MRGGLPGAGVFPEAKWGNVKGAVSASADGPDFSRGERQARAIWTRVYRIITGGRRELEIGKERWAARSVCSAPHSPKRDVP